MTNTMVQTASKTMFALMTALFLSAGVAVAQGPASLATGQGAAEAAGEAAGSYYVDASGATEAAEDHNDDTRQQLADEWDATNRAYEHAKADAREQIDNAEPATPEDLGEDEVFGELEQVSTVEASHTDTIEKAADLETGYVDAGADLSATGSMKAWFSNAFDGVRDAYDGVKGMLGFQTQAKEDAKATAYQALEADDQIRGQITETLAQDQDLPELDPSASGDLSVSHATEIATSAVGQAGIP